MAATKKSHRWISWLLFILYNILLIYLLFFAESMGREADDSYHYNLTLFHEIQRYLEYADQIDLKYWLINLFGNVLAFIPMGYLLPRIFPSKQFASSVIVYCFCFSAIVEIVQLVTRLGCCDVDDVLLNTIGGIIGYFICWLLHGREFQKPGRRY